MIEGRTYLLVFTSEQEARATEITGACRALWNAALEQRRAAWRMNRRGLRARAQCLDLTEARNALPWLREAPAQVLQQTLRDLDSAHVRWWQGHARRPRFRRKGRGESFRIPGQALAVRRLSRRWGEVRVPKLGWCRFRWTRALGGEVRNATVSRSATGWRVSFCVETAREAASPNGLAAVGVDRGVVATAALSTGELHHCPGLSPRQAGRLRRLARKTGRQETARRRRPNGQRVRSRRHQRTLTALARLKAREVRIRDDFLHKLTTDLAKSHGVVAIEDLRVGSMTRSAKGTVEQPGRGVAQKRGLNREVLAQGWGELRRQLAYKSEWYGSRLVEVPAAFSSQECAECRSVDPRSRRSRDHFRCVACGHNEHADVNAARVILARAETTQEDRGRTGRDSAGSPGVGPGKEPRTAWEEAARVAA